MECAVIDRSDQDDDLPRAVSHSGPMTTLSLWIPHHNDGFTYHVSLPICAAHAILRQDDQAFVATGEDE